MIIAVDDVIPYGREAFSSFEAVRFYSARTLVSADIRDVDALVVRSITRVDETLLNGSNVSLVGTASIGMDNLDIDYLNRSGISYTNAAGSNANAVSEYVVAALLVVASRRGWALREKSIAVIGVGNVGTRVVQKAEALGMKVLLCDPPLLESTRDARYRRLEEVLHADIISLHTPLTKSGPHATYHMIRDEVVARLSPLQIVINTARGSVIREADLKPALLSDRIGGAVLDVWENEPRIDHELAAHAEIVSPHIAGYSLDGKVAATRMMLEAVCRRSGKDVAWDFQKVFPPRQTIRVGSSSRGENLIREVVLQAYEIGRDDSELRSLAGLTSDEAAREFDRQRNEYPLRLEFHHFRVELPSGRAEEAATLERLGFEVSRE